MTWAGTAGGDMEAIPHCVQGRHARGAVFGFQIISPLSGAQAYGTHCLPAFSQVWYLLERC